MNERAFVIALDVGGSTVKSGLVDTEFAVTHTTSTPIASTGSPEEIFSTFAQIIQQHQEQVRDAPLLGAGFGFPSPFDYERGIVLIQDQPKYNAIYGMNVADAIQQRLPFSIAMRFRNDAEAAIIGEATYGAGKGHHKLLGITLGTGLGSSFVQDGVRIAEGASVPPTGFLFSVPYNDGIADDVFSTRGLLAKFAAAGISVETVAAAKKAADSGEEAVKAVFAQWGAELGDFLRGYVQRFGAEVVIALGGITGAFAYFEADLHEAVGVPVRLGALGAQAALLGAADLWLKAE